MNIAILGYGREGKAIHRFLRKDPAYRGAPITILDKVRTKNYLRNLERFDLIFRSPGVPYMLPALVCARKKGVSFSSSTMLFFERCPGKIIGITGTKGKGTTSTLLYKILRTCGKDVHLAGNIGKPAIDVLPKIKRNSLVVLELSSFQLQDLEQSPHVAAVLDVFPDHLDAHKSLKEYLEAKTHIARYQKTNNVVFYFPDNLYSAKIASAGWGKKMPVNVFDARLIATPIPGLHNRRNVKMALTIAAHLGCKGSKARAAIMRFRGLEHRLEFVKKAGRIAFYNDSASTNPETAAAAVRAFAESPTILIAGGKDKNLDYAPLARTLTKLRRSVSVVLFGENKGKMRKHLAGSKVTMVNVEETKGTDALKKAVRIAYALARKYALNDTSAVTHIIFSPGAASFDMFKDYQERGARFKDIVKKLRK